MTSPPLAAGDIIARTAGADGPPLSVHFQVTDRCNYSCVHCYQQHVAEGELSYDEIERILCEIADAGVLFLSLAGGEFFMHPQADRILERAHELGFAVKLLTTGHHVHDRRADFLATLRPIQIDLSLYAAGPEIHERVTDQRGSWERTLSAARRLRERGLPVMLKTPLMELNAREVAELRALAEELGAKYLFDAKITSMETGETTPLELRMGAESLNTLYRSDDNGLGRLLADHYAGKNERELRPLNHSPCGAADRACSIGPRGEVKACGSLPMALGDLRQQTFSEVWSESRGLAAIRAIRWSDISDCKVCELRGFCQRCHAMALLEDGDMLGPSLEACRHAVAVRDALREKGLLPEDHRALPPTWERVDADGRHENTRSPRSGVRPARLRVL